MRRLIGPGGPGEEGTVAIFVALTLTVLFGLAALVIDGGALAQERRELQNGADSAALALAEKCAANQCPVDMNADATIYAGLNASDSQSRAFATRSGNSVRVVTKTRDSSGDQNGVDFTFAPVINGGTSKEVQAAATAAWSTASGGATPPITFSLCEWDEMISAGGVFNQTPKVIYFHDPNKKPKNPPPKVPCTRQPGQDTDADSNINGGFGWLDVGSNCSATVTIGGWVGSNTGVSTPNQCQPSVLINSPIFVPIFDQAVDTNDPDWANQCADNRCYHIYGYATVKVTGFRFPGNGWTWPAGAPPCNPPDSCIAGIFTNFTLGWTGGTGGGPDLGTYVVRLTE
jgi:Flp pilus assembly protein TadG